MKTGFVVGTAASAIAVATLMPSVDAHGSVILPPPVWTTNDRQEQYKPLSFLEGAGVPVSDDLPGFMKSRGYNTLRDMMDDRNLYTVGPGVDFACGRTRMDTPVPIPDTNNYRVTGYTHDGPCEVWLDDTLVASGQNCHAEFPGKTHDFDYSSCGNSCTLRWYWLGVRFLKNKWSWQIYKNCVPLVAPGGAQQENPEVQNEANGDYQAEEQDYDQANENADATKAPDEEPTGEVANEQNGDTQAEEQTYEEEKSTDGSNGDATETDDNADAPATGCGAKLRRN